MQTKNMFKRVAAAAGSAVLLGSLAVTTSGTATAASTASCTVPLQAITSAGELKGVTVTGTKPPTSASGTPQHEFTAGAAKLASNWSFSALPAGASLEAYVVLGTSLYAVSDVYSESTGQWEHKETKVGINWDKFSMIEESWAGLSSSSRNARYGLRNDGVLFRWTNGFQTVASAAGFSDIKAMTLISQTATYDTFLATTKAGVLETIRIPSTAPLKPVVKTVRGSTWQGFETLVANSCGTGTLLTAIDKDTNSAYVYSIGHATGTTTPITNLGKVSGTFADPVYSRYRSENDPMLAGE
ncbi:hypothetical protein ACIA49_08495 [Kribbella sp. NPDC051587]|uniref:hypothetical protein n=1 Tax=Kribbella sp. NPDC051587 TaxID=3364119 RepID=UPI0037BC5EEA